MREGWEVKTLSDISDVRDGTHDSPKYIDEGYPLITSKNLKNGKLTYDKIKYISEEDYININKRSKVDIGDILFAMIGTIGNPVIIKDEPNYAIKNVALFKVYDDYDSSFLKYYLNSSYVIDKMQSEAKGTTQKFVGLGYLRKFPIIVPPLKEQTQIVETLDSAFAQIDQAKANLEKNLANAKELFQSKLNEVFSQRGEGWVEKRLGDVCKYDKKKYINNNLPYIGLENIESNTGKFIGSLEPINVKSSTFYFSSEHLLYGRLRPYLNKVLMPNFEGHCSTEIFPIKIGDETLREFLFYWFISDTTVKKIDATWTGARMPRANMKEVINFKLTLPIVSKQIEIVDTLNMIYTQINNLQTHYQQKLNNLEELKKSILEKAFRGEL